MLARDPRKVEMNVTDERIAKMESDVGHLKTDVADIKVKMDKMSERMEKFYESLNEKMDKLRDGLWMTRIEMLLIGAGLLAVIARVFKWI